MIKILELGEKAKPRTHKCSNCGSKFEFSLSDCDYTTLSEYGYTKIKSYNINCPACHHMIEISNQ